MKPVNKMMDDLCEAIRESNGLEFTTAHERDTLIALLSGPKMYYYLELPDGLCLYQGNKEDHSNSDYICTVTNFVDADALLQHLNNT